VVSRSAVLQSRFCHAFADAAVLDELGLEGADLLIEEIICLVDNADRDVGDDIIGAGVDEFSVIIEV
jgi:hypothetical protein